MKHARWLAMVFGCAVGAVVAFVGSVGAAEISNDPWAPKQQYLDSPYDRPGGLSGVYSSSNTPQRGALSRIPAARDSSAVNGPIIAILGDGVDVNHEDLQFQVLREQLDNTSPVVQYSCSSSGCSRATPPPGPLATAVAGIAAAQTGNGIGMAGACPGCRILNIKLSSYSNGDISQGVAQAVQAMKAYFKPGDLTTYPEGVILILYGDAPLAYDATLERYLANIFRQFDGTSLGGINAQNTRIVVVTPAGNGVPLAGTSALYYPTDNAGYPCSYSDSTDKTVLCVGSVDGRLQTLGERSVFSNFGDAVDMFAPGEQIVATAVSDGNPGTADPTAYTYLSDTAAAAAIVAGSAGIVDFVSDVTPQELQETFRFTQFALPRLEGLLPANSLHAADAANFTTGNPGNVTSPTDPIGIISFPPQNWPVKPGESITMKGTVARCSTYTITLVPIVTSPSVGTITLKPSTACSTSLRKPNATLGSALLVPATHPQGEYELQLTVTNSSGVPKTAHVHFFVDKAYDARFSSGPKLLNDVVFHGANVVDVTGDGQPDIVLGSANGRVYVYNGTGALLTTLQTQGRIMAMPAVGQIDGNLDREIVVTSDIAGGTSLKAWKTATWTLGFSANVGPIRSGASITKQGIFATTQDNQLFWRNTSGVVTSVSVTDPSVCTSPVLFPDACQGYPLMESTPLVASLNANTPSRVFVPSQEAFTTFGFDPSTGLGRLPGFPLPWNSTAWGGGPPAPGGSLDAVLAPVDNTGAIHMFLVRYLRDPNPCQGPDCHDQSELDYLEVQGATTAQPPQNLRLKPKSTNFLVPSSYPIRDDLFMYSSTATADTITGDGGWLETYIVGMSGTVYAFNGNMDPIWTAKMRGRGAGVPLIADIDGDGALEILTTDQTGLVYAWRADTGSLKTNLASGAYGFPRAMRSPACFLPRPPASPLRNWAIADIIRCGALAVGDIDGSEETSSTFRNELIAVAGSGSTSNNGIYVWDFGQPGLVKLNVIDRFFAALAPIREALMPTAEAVVGSAPPPLWGVENGREDGSRLPKAGSLMVYVNQRCGGVELGRLDGATVKVLRPGTQSALDPLDMNGNGISDQVDAGICSASGPPYQCRYPAAGPSPVVATGGSATYWNSLNTGTMYDVEVSKSGYFTETQTNVSVVLGGATMRTFDLLCDDITPPVISNVQATNVTASGATITWTTNEASDSQVNYGLTSSYGSQTPLNATLVTSHSVALSGLLSNRTYHYQVKSKDAAANLATSGDFTFTTSDTTPPVISNVAATATSTTATITWTTNEASDSQVNYGLTLSYGSQTPLNPTLVTSHSVALSGLTANTQYNYQVRSRDAAGNLATSGNYTFTTTCHILTAAYGNPQALPIQTLRTVVDRSWARTPSYQRFARWYSREGPKMAAFVSDKPMLRALIRAVFTPAARAAQWWLDQRSAAPVTE